MSPVKERGVQSTLYWDWDWYNISSIDYQQLHIYVYVCSEVCVVAITSLDWNNLVMPKKVAVASLVVKLVP